jgi:tetratricopeptide (TPR) repeat protein
MTRFRTRKLLLIAAIVLVATTSFAQQPYFDSLRQSLLYKHSSDSMVFYYDKWLPISIQINHDSTQADLEKLKQLYVNSKDEFINAVYLIQHAYWYTEKTGDYQKGLQEAIEAKCIFERWNAKPQLVISLCRIAFFKLWNEIGLQKSALNEGILNDYLLPAQKIAESTKDNDLKITTYQWIGSYYNVSKLDHKSALAYFLKAEKLSDEHTNPILKLTNLASIGIVYTDLCDKENMLLYLDKYEKSEFSKYYLYGLGNLYRAIANYYLHCERNSEKALFYAQKAYDLAQQMKAPEYTNLSQRRLYEVYKQMGKTEMALQFLELHKESELALARNKFEFAYTEYDVQNKEQMILRQKYRLQQKNIFIAIALSSLLILAGFSLVIFKIRQKNQLLQLKELEKQKQLQLDIAVRATQGKFAFICLAISTPFIWLGMMMSVSTISTAMLFNC